MYFWGPVSEELAAILIVLNLEVVCHFPLATSEILCCGFSFDYGDLVWISLVLYHLGFTQHFESEPLCFFARFRKLSALFLGIFFSAPPCLVP